MVRIHWGVWAPVGTRQSDPDVLAVGKACPYMGPVTLSIWGCPCSTQHWGVDQVLPLRVFLFLFFLVCVFIWLYWVLVAARGIFSCGMQVLCCSMWDPIPQLGIELGPPSLGAWSLQGGPSLGVLFMPYNEPPEWNWRRLNTQLAPSPRGNDVVINSSCFPADNGPRWIPVFNGIRLILEQPPGWWAVRARVARSWDLGCQLSPLWTSIFWIPSGVPAAPTFRYFFLLMWLFVFWIKTMDTNEANLFLSLQLAQETFCLRGAICNWPHTLFIGFVI